MIVNPDGSVIVSADPRGPIVDINDYLYGPWMAHIMQQAQMGQRGGGQESVSPWEQKIPARKSRSSGQGGTQQTQQQAPDVQQGVQQLQQSILQAARQMLPNVDQGVRQMQQGIGQLLQPTQATLQTTPQKQTVQPTDWYDRLLLSPPYEPAGFFAKLFRLLQQGNSQAPSQEQTEQPINWFDRLLLSPPYEPAGFFAKLSNMLQQGVASQQSPYSIRAGVDVASLTPSAPTTSSIMPAFSIGSGVDITPTLDEDAAVGIYPEYTFDWGPFSLGAAGAGAAGGALYNAYRSQGKNAPPLPTPIEDSVTRAMAQTPATTKSLSELHGDIDWVKVAAGDPVESAKATEWRARFAQEKAIYNAAEQKPLNELHGDIDWAKAAAGDPIESIKAENWRNRFGYEKAIYNAAEQKPLNELHGDIDWAKVAAGDPIESIKAENWRNRFGYEKAVYNKAQKMSLQNLHGDIDWAKVAAGDPIESIKAENWRDRFGQEKAIYNAAGQKSLKKLHGDIDWKKAAEGDNVESIKAENWRNRFGYEKAVYDPEGKRSTTKLVANPKPASSLTQLIRNNLKTFGRQLKGNAKVMAPIGLGLIGLSKLLEDSPAQAAPVQMPPLEEWEARIKAADKPLEPAWNPLESLIVAPYAAGGSFVRMLANYLTDAVFQNAMIYGTSDNNEGW